MSSANDVLPMLATILERLAAIESKIASGGGASVGSANASAESGGDGLPKSITAFDEYCTTNLDPFVAACNKLGEANGGDILKIGQAIKDAWMALRSYLLMASSCKKPVGAVPPALVSDIAAAMKAVGTLVSRNEWEKHGKTASEGVSCLNWIMIEGTPREFIESYIGGSDYWSNGIRKEFRTTNSDQIAFCDTFKALITNLMGYVKEHHLTGVTWNPKGVSISEYKPGAAASSPKPAATTAAASAPKAVSTASSSAPKVDLFAALNKGGEITSGLKTVTKDMQTWRTEFKGGDAPAPKAPVPKAPALKAVVMKQSPKLEYNDVASKWLVEYQTDKVDIEIKDIRETVYVFGCVGATIHVKGKCKSVILDGCKKTSVVFDVVMASFEVVNCQRVNATCTDTVSAVAIDKTDGIVVTLPTSSMHTEVVASKSSEMNLQFPGPDGELVERPIPEQYVHRIKDGAITANVSDLYSH